MERRTAEQMLSGRGIINTTTTRTGRSIKDAFPTMAIATSASAAVAAQAGAVFHDPKSTLDQAPWHKAPSDYTPSYNPSSSLYLGPSSVSGLKGLGGKSAAGSGSAAEAGAGKPRAGRGNVSGGGRMGAAGNVASPATAVRFAPTQSSPGAAPAPREAWGAASSPPASPPPPPPFPEDVSMPSRSSSAHSGRAQAGAAGSGHFGGFGSASFGGGGGGDGGAAWMDHAEPAAAAPQAAVTFSAWNQGEGATIMGSAHRGQQQFGQPASSAAVASGTTGATGSGGSGLTEKNLREINRAAKVAAQLRADARAAEAIAYGSSSRNSPRHSSSFRSDLPYAAGLSARMANQPLGPAAASWY